MYNVYTRRPKASTQTSDGTDDMKAIQQVLAHVRAFAWDCACRCALLCEPGKRSYTAT